MYHSNGNLMGLKWIWTAVFECENTLYQINVSRVDVVNGLRARAYHCCVCPHSCAKSICWFSHWGFENLRFRHDIQHTVQQWGLTFNVSCLVCFVCALSTATTEKRQHKYFNQLKSITNFPWNACHAASNRLSIPCVWVKAVDEKDYTVTAWAFKRTCITGISTSTAMQRPTSANSSFCLFFVWVYRYYTRELTKFLLSLVIYANNL